MVRTQRLLALLVVVALALAVVPGSAAADTRAGDSVVVGENETVDGLTAFGGSVVVHGTVDGDVTALGGTVVVYGTVTGDVTALGGTVEIDDGGVVRGDLTAAGGAVTIAGRVGGDVNAAADTVTLTDTAVVAGTLSYDGDLVRAPGATVAGGVVQDSFGVGPFPSIPDWVGALSGVVSTLVVGALLVAVLPGFTDRVADAAVDAPGRSALSGLGFLVFAPITLVLIAFTLIGIPVTILGFVAYAVLLTVGFVAGNYTLGRYVLSIREMENRWIALLVGVLLVAALDLAPLVGGLVQLAVLLVGVGALVRALVGAYRNRRDRRNGDADATPSNEPTA
ncbi:polymer-forming cytoskeletal protein [Salarchaeum sp. JOR-1]|uniref:bactofilin family protein n=1 Tax=Salarchaeum sp. JOR-1 TaxID=2599399 RepID=UPI001198BF9F|nr:polymer-forming cytoskeletal protein [Salarchaeum sp. JOR-1]QDX40142.1 polymer-forming cytoskeletal protein [Salarchaeum sp. JOR-1]